VNEIVKDLIVEMIHYKNRKLFFFYNKYLIKAHDSLGMVNITPQLGQLIKWIDPLYHSDKTDPDKLKLYTEYMDEEEIKARCDTYVKLFNKVPEFYALFRLEKEHIEFNSELSKNDIIEVYCFVREINEPRNIMR